jgi:replicative DNA helicase
VSVAPLQQNSTEEVRQMPHNFAAEQALLGAILVDNNAYHRVSDFLLPPHFADPLHGRIFEASARLIERNQVANPITLRPFFDREEALIDRGSAKYFAQLAGAAIGIIDAADYARQIHQLFLRRQLIEVGTDVVNEAFAPPTEDAMELVANAEAKLFAIADNGSAEDRLKDSKSSLSETFDQIDEEIRQRGLPESERSSNRILTGIAGLDEKLAIRPGHAVYIAGDTSMGKSVLADVISEHNERRGIPSAFFAMEMTNVELDIRRLARISGINAHYIENGDIKQHEYERLHSARLELEQLPYWVDHTPGLTPSQLRARLRRLRRKHGIGLAVVDYLQLMQSDRGGRRPGTRAEELGIITRSIKTTAAEIGIPIIVVSQITRGIHARDDKRPQLADLRESGSIEQDANSVIFAYREEYYLSRGKPVGKGGKSPSPQDEFDYEKRLDDSRGLAELIVAKQRQGEAPFTVKVRFEGARFRFRNLVDSASPPATGQGDLYEEVPL